METLELQYPIIIDGVETRTITLRRPLVRDRLIAEKSSNSEIEKEIRLMANICEMAPDDIEQLDMLDYTMLQERLVGFLS